MKQVFSMNDMYPMSSQSATTQEETIPDTEERQDYVDSTTTDAETGKTMSVDKTMILGAFGLFIGLMILLHILE